MSMSNEELAAIRERSESIARWKGREEWSIAQEDRKALLAEVERLRGERDEIAAAAGKAAYERDRLQARLDKVRALHKPETYGGAHQECSHCVDPADSHWRIAYPCPTIRAIDGSDQ
jgi:hypothetical protein